GAAGSERSRRHLGAQQDQKVVSRVNADISAAPAAFGVAEDPGVLRAVVAEQHDLAGIDVEHTAIAGRKGAGRDRAAIDDRQRLGYFDRHAAGTGVDAVPALRLTADARREDGPHAIDQYGAGIDGDRSGTAGREGRGVDLCTAFQRQRIGHDIDRARIAGTAEIGLAADAGEAGRACSIQHDTADVDSDRTRIAGTERLRDDLSVVAYAQRVRDDRVD